MDIDASAFRNLGVECLLVNCRMCGTPERYSVYDDGSQQGFYVGCTQCGVCDSITKEDFDALYELSDLFDELMEGTITTGQFEKSMPASIRELYVELSGKSDTWKCSNCENMVPAEYQECWNCGKASEQELESGLIQTGYMNPEEEQIAQKENCLEMQKETEPKSLDREYRSVRLSNTLTSSWMLAPVFTIPIAVGIVAVEATGLFNVPFFNYLSDVDGTDYAVLKPFQYWNDFIFPVIMLQFFLFPVFVGVLHFKLPRAVLFSIKGIEVRYRSGSKRIYEFSDVLETDYNQDRNFLKMKMNDGKNVRVELDLGQAASLRDYLPL